MRDRVVRGERGERRGGPEGHPGASVPRQGRDQGCEKLPSGRSAACDVVDFAQSRFPLARQPLARQLRYRDSFRSHFAGPSLCLLGCASSVAPLVSAEHRSTKRLLSPGILARSGGRPSRRARRLAATTFLLLSDTDRLHFVFRHTHNLPDLAPRSCPVGRVTELAG